MFTAKHKVGCASIGRQHTFFNQAVRIVAYHANNFFDPTKFVTDDFCFNRVEIDRAAFFATLRKQFKQLI